MGKQPASDLEGGCEQPNQWGGSTCLDPVQASTAELSEFSTVSDPIFVAGPVGSNFAANAGPCSSQLPSGQVGPEEWIRKNLQQSHCFDDLENTCVNEWCDEVPSIPGSQEPDAETLRLRPRFASIFATCVGTSR